MAYSNIPKKELEARLHDWAKRELRKIKREWRKSTR